MGGHRRIAMADLRAALENLGFTNVRTYLQSGNAVFGAEPAEPSPLAARIVDALEHKTGEHVDVLVQTAEEMADAAGCNPFASVPGKGIDPKHLHVVFLFDEPSRAQLASLDPPAAQGEQVAPVGRLVYLHLPNGAGRTKLTTAYFERALDTRATARNWNTVTALAREGGGTLTTPDCMARHDAPAPAPVTVRAASRDDNVLLAELGARTFFDAFAEQNDPEDMAAYMAEAFGPDIQAAELSEPGTTFLVAEAAGTAVGYARLRRHPVPEAIPGARRVELARLYADRAWIGRGVGGALMKAALGVALAEGCDVMWLSTWDRNLRGIAFYRRWGFEVVGEQDFLVGTDVQHDLLFARAVASGWPV